MNNEIEIPLDIDEATVEKLREAIGLKEIEEIHNRFVNGTETENDLLNYVPRFILKTDKGEFDIVRYKHYQKLVNLYKQEKEKNKNCKKQEYTVGRLDERKAWQYKIKAKIEKLEKIQVLHSRYGEIKVLQELLEEN